MTGSDMSAQSSDQGRVYQVGQGTMIVNTTTPRPVAVVTSILGLDAAAPEVFVGRDHEIQTLLAGLDPHGHSPSAVVVSAVAGMGGVGKSALARHAAGIAVDRQWFPGGAVWVDLQGYEPTRRIEVGQVFGPMLRALGVPGDEIPVSDSEQAAAYHRLLGKWAQQGRRVLLVLDNASASDQVRDLLPNQRVHRAIVTTRDTLDLPAATLNLDVLNPDEAVALLDEALRERLPGDARVAQDHDAATRVVELCGRLPLAVRIVAGLLKDEPDLTLSDLANELDASTRLDVLAHGGRGVSGAFDLSWQHLQDQHAKAARVLRLLVLNPGPDLSTDAAAALAGMSTAAVRPLLRILRQAYLVQQEAGRWRLHDLIDLYLTNLPTDDEAVEEFDAVRGRLFNYYLSVADAADDHVRALPGQPVPDLFAGRDAALAWLDRERANLIATVEHAASADDHLVAVRLANLLAEFLRWRRHFTDWAIVAQHAARSVQHLDDPYREATASTILGMALREVGRLDEAIAAHQRAVALYQQAGDRYTEGLAWNNLGIALRVVERLDEAIAAHQQALAIFQETADRHLEGTAWNNLGLALWKARRFEEAITALEQDIAICQELTDRHGEGMTWDNLGLVLWDTGRFDDAINAHQLALPLFRETGDRHGEGRALLSLGWALRETGRSEEARECWLEAVKAFTASNAPEDVAEVRRLLEGPS